MPPASGRRRGGRRDTASAADPPQPSDGHLNDAVHTPSRKRRRVGRESNSDASQLNHIQANGADQATDSPRGSQRRADAAIVRRSASKRQKSADTEETIENTPPRDLEAEQQAAFQLADEVIRHLTVAHYRVMASTDYHNDIVQKSAQAFAKVAGRDWAFYG